jgi:hypothetical protein
MTLNFDPEVADVLAQLGGTDAFQPPRDDVEGYFFGLKRRREL